MFSCFQIWGDTRFQIDIESNIITKSQIENMAQTGHKNNFEG